MSKLGSAVLYLRLRARLTLSFFPPLLCPCRRRLRQATLFLVAVGDVLPISFVVTVVTVVDVIKVLPVRRCHRHPTSPLSSPSSISGIRPLSSSSSTYLCRHHCSTACLCRRCRLRPTFATAVVNVFVTFTGVLHATTLY